jgi:hypothetical protein
VSKYQYHELKPCSICSPEITLRIAQSLPTTSSLSFALCNKRSAAQLGIKPENLPSRLKPKIAYTSSPFSHEIPLATTHAMGVSAPISAVPSHNRQTPMHHPSSVSAFPRLLAAVVQKMGSSTFQTTILLADVSYSVSYRTPPFSSSKEVCSSFR